MRKRTVSVSGSRGWREGMSFDVAVVMRDRDRLRRAFDHVCRDLDCRYDKEPPDRPRGQWLALEEQKNAMAQLLDVLDIRAAMLGGC